MSAFNNVGGRFGSNIVQLVSILRQIAIKTCFVFSAGLLTSIVAYVVLRRLEPPVPVAVDTAAEATGEESPGPRPGRGHEETVNNTIASTAGSLSDGGAAGAVIADRTSSIDIKMAHRMPFSETHV